MKGFRLGPLGLSCLFTACGPGKAVPPPPPPIVVPAPVGSDEPESGPLPESREQSAVPRYVDRPHGSKEDTARAAALFDEARKLLNQGQTAEACDRFEQSLNADPALGSLLNLAVCKERLGETARACELLGQALEWAERDKSNARASFIRSKRAELVCP